MSFSIVVEEPGPLYVRLEYDGHDSVLRVNGWDPTPHGGPGPVEITNMVRAGDALVAVNTASLAGLSLKASVKMIKQAASPRNLTFYRPHFDHNFLSDRLNDLDRGNGKIGWSKLHNILCEDQENIINESKLRELSSRGFSDSSPIRPIVWRLLLQYLPKDRSEWPAHLTCQRGLYQQFVREFLHNCTERGDSRWSCFGDAPVMIQTSMWTQQQHDFELKQEIHKDIVRTCPEHHFFEGEGAIQRQAMERILFIYAKLNPGVRYVQGMNEVLGIIFYVLASDPSEEWGAGAEPDAFFCFTNIMGELRDVYIHSLDNSDVGLSGKMSRVNDLLRHHDPELWKHLNRNQLDPSYYSLRWITTLLAREFTLPDTIRLWDTVFSKIARVDFLCYFCLTMILAQRGTLLQGDFSHCMYLLQHYPPSDPNVLLKQTHLLQQEALGDHESASIMWWT